MPFKPPAVKFGDVVARFGARNPQAEPKVAIVRKVNDDGTLGLEVMDINKIRSYGTVRHRNDPILERMSPEDLANDGCWWTCDEWDNHLEARKKALQEERERQRLATLEANKPAAPPEDDKNPEGKKTDGKSKTQAT